MTTLTPSTRTSAHVRHFTIIAIALLGLVLLGSAPALAQQPGVGVRAGVSGDPDQFYVGVHFDTGAFVDRLSFRPNAEIGFGDSQTLVAGNFEFAYWWHLPGHPWMVYAGGGPAVVFRRFDENHGDDTHVDPGFNFLIGLAHRGGFFVEAKLGLMHSPEGKFGVGYTWR